MSFSWYHSDSRGRDLLLVAAFVSFDLFVKRFLSGYVVISCNPYGPWGIAVDGRVMAILAVPILTGVFLSGCRSDVRGIRTGSLLIVSGGIGNLLDRIFLGCVRDIPVSPYFPAFNAADVMLTVGSAVIVWHATVGRRRSGLV